jgi:hypothetical protein
MGTVAGANKMCRKTKKNAWSNMYFCPVLSKGDDLCRHAHAR